MGRIALMYWITAVWMVLSSPIMFALIGVAVIARRAGVHGGGPSGVSRREWLLPSAFVIASVLLGGVFGNDAIQMPEHAPLAVWLIGLVFVAQAVFAAIIIRRARRRGVALAGMAVWLWLGALASWVAHWSVTAGGTLGAL